jgi:signal transduction histidine kinase
VREKYDPVLAVTLTVVATSKFVSSRTSSSPTIIIIISTVSTGLTTILLLAVAFVFRKYSQAEAKRELVIEREKYVTSDRPCECVFMGVFEHSRAVIAQAAQAAHETTLSFTFHELRNPLHAISASAAFLAERIPPGDEGYEDIQSILTGAGQMHRLVNDVLDLGKLRAGKLAIQPEPFDLRYAIISWNRFSSFSAVHN